MYTPFKESPETCHIFKNLLLEDVRKITLSLKHSRTLSSVGINCRFLQSHIYFIKSFAIILFFLDKSMTIFVCSFSVIFLNVNNSYPRQSRGAMSEGWALRRSWSTRSLAATGTGNTGGAGSRPASGLQGAVSLDTLTAQPGNSSSSVESRQKSVDGYTAYSEEEGLALLAHCYYYYSNYLFTFLVFMYNKK